jgi:hypothetical protein
MEKAGKNPKDSVNELTNITRKEKQYTLYTDPLT